MASDEELLNQLKLSREYKKRIWTLNNKLLAVKAERLKILKQHYKDFWLDLDLWGHDSKLDSLVSRTRFTVYQTSMKRISELVETFNQENARLDDQIDEVRSRLEKFKNLDSSLLAEHRKLKDDLECQQMLIEISENNTKNS